MIIFENRHMRPNGSVCLISVDEVDFRIREPIPFSSKWFSHKMQTGWIVWVNGPFPAGDWPDLAVARHVLHHMLDDF